MAHKCIQMKMCNSLQIFNMAQHSRTACLPQPSLKVKWLLFNCFIYVILLIFMLFTKSCYNFLNMGCWNVTIYSFTNLHALSDLLKNVFRGISMFLLWYIHIYIYKELVEWWTIKLFNLFYFLVMHSSFIIYRL